MWGLLIQRGKISASAADVGGWEGSVASGGLWRHVDGNLFRDVSSVRGVLGGFVGGGGVEGLPAGTSNAGTKIRGACRNQCSTPRKISGHSGRSEVGGKRRLSGFGSGVIWGKSYVDGRKNNLLYIQIVVTSVVGKEGAAYNRLGERRHFHTSRR